MSTLSGQKIKDKFGNLLHVEGGLTSTTKDVEDGTGDASALKLSTTTVEVDGTLNFTSAPSTDNTESTALLIDGSDNVVKRELNSVAFNGQAFPEMVIGTVETDQAITGSATETLVFAAIDNGNDGKSFHLYSGTSVLTLTPASGEVLVGQDGLLKISGSFRAVVPTNNTTINYTIERSTDSGSTWSSYSEVDVIKSTGDATAVQVHSFFDTFLVRDGYIYRIRITPSATITVKPGTQVEFNRLQPQ
jgi:hypothetical protein